MSASANEKSNKIKKQLEQRLEESEAIAAISHALATTLNLDQLLQLIVETAQRVVPLADWSAIHLLDSTNNHLINRASSGVRFPIDTYNIPRGKGIAGRVLNEGELINVPDLQIDERRLPIDDKMKARALLAAPVESRFSRLGVISVQSSSPGAFTKSDERLLKVLGIQAGMAIENARLYTEQQKARQLAENRLARMQELTKHIITAQETERGRIARELHDESGQSLTALKISLELIKLSLPENLNEIKQELQSSIGLVDKTMNNLRLISHNLRPPSLDAYGLHVSLEGLCHDFKKHTALTIEYEGVELPNLDVNSSLVLYRVAQEGLTNIVKHANATSATVRLSSENARISLEIIDNGDGFDISAIEQQLPRQGAGLAGMQERLDLLNGGLTITSVPNEGSHITATLPYREVT